MPELIASEAPIAEYVDPATNRSLPGLATTAFRSFLQGIADDLNALGQSQWTDPTGTGSRATFNMDFTTAVSNPPTQAEVTAIRDQLVIVQKRLGQLVIDLQAAGVLG